MIISEFIDLIVIRLSIDALFIICISYVGFIAFCKSYARFRSIRKEPVETEKLSDELPPPKFEVLKSGRFRITEYDGSGIRHSRVYARKGQNLDLVYLFRDKGDEVFRND